MFKQHKDYTCTIFGRGITTHHLGNVLQNIPSTHSRFTQAWQFCVRWWPFLADVEWKRNPFERLEWRLPSDRGPISVTAEDISTQKHLIFPTSREHNATVWFPEQPSFNKRKWWFAPSFSMVTIWVEKKHLQIYCRCSVDQEYPIVDTSMPYSTSKNWSPKALGVWLKWMAIFEVVESPPMFFFFRGAFFLPSHIAGFFWGVPFKKSLSGRLWTSTNERGRSGL